MLVLSRKAGESIVVDGDIRITITHVQGNRVRIGVDAPPSVSIKRSELCERTLPYAEAQSLSQRQLELASA